MKDRRNGLFGAAILATALVLGAAQPAAAGKPERDKADELKPVLTSVAADVKTNCGCDVQVSADFDSFPSVDEMSRIDQTLDQFKGAVSKYCEKPADKAEFCKNVASLQVISNKKIDELKLDGKDIKAPTGGTQYTTEAMFSGLFNKF